MQNILDTKRYSVQLLQGVNAAGERIYYALLMKRNLMQKTLRLIQQNKKRPEEVAVVLAEGVGEPPADLPAQIKRLLEQMAS